MTTMELDLKGGPLAVYELGQAQTIEGFGLGLAVVTETGELLYRRFKDCHSILIQLEGIDGE